MSPELIERKWAEEIEAHKAEARMCRGQWLLPRFEGLRRTNRTRLTQEHELMRNAPVQDANQMEMLWRGGAQQLDRFRASIQPTITVAPTKRAPDVDASIADMPVAADFVDQMRLAMGREVPF